MLTDLLNRPCTITRRGFDGPADGDGNATATSSSVETVCELQQRARPENTDAGTVATTTWALYLLPETSLAVGDAVTVDGQRYEVDGDPAEMRNPRTGVVEHVQATLVKTTGTVTTS